MSQSSVAKPSNRLAQSNGSKEPPIHALASSYYTDEGTYRRVREQIFFRTWQLAGHISQLKAPGDYLTFAIFDQDLLIVRDRDNELRVFFNVCQHRGHPLLTDSGSTRLIVCPYHAWTYELDGQLRAAPNAKKVTGFDRRKICLREVRHEVFCGFVFVNLDANAPSMNDAYPGVEEAIREFCPDINQREFVHEHTAEEFCNWLVAVENYNECYHCKVAHPSFAVGVIDPKSYNIYPFGSGKCLRHDSAPAEGASAWYDTSGSDYGSFYLWPATSIQIYPGGLVNTYHWRPLATDNTRVHRGWYSLDGEISSDLQKIIALDRDTTFTEDLKLVKSVQRGLNNIGYRPGPLIVDPNQGIDSEHSIAALHNWMREAVDV